MKAKHDIVKAFIDKLGDIENWDYYGNFYVNEKELESCVCGHGIKNIYVIENHKLNKTAKVGSVCINNFKFYNKALYDKLCKAEEKRIEEIRKASKAREESEKNKQYQKLTEELKVKRKYLLELRDSWGAKRIPSDLYYALRNIKAHCPKTYKRSCSYVKWAEKEIVKANNIMENAEEWRNTEPLPEYLKNKYIGIIWFGKYEGKKVADLPVNYLRWLSANYEPKPFDDKENDFQKDLLELFYKKTTK